MESQAVERRAKFRKGLSSLYLPAYDALCAELGPEWGPYSGLRTFIEQALLWEQGRSAPGKIVTRAKAGESPHNYGCATDWCLWVDGKPHWPDAGDPAWEPYLAAIEKCGLVAGASFGDYPHNELKISCSWKHISVEFFKSGMRAAQEHIESNVVK